jgi:acetyltransferase-like isoleucine patch superfamily enzyme
MINTGSDVFISDNAEIRYKDLASIGNHVAIDYGFYCTTQLEVHDYVHISSHCSVIGGRNSKLLVEDFGFISTGSRIICGSDNMLGDGLVGPVIPKKYKDSQTIGTILIKRFAGTGANSVIMPNVTMAEGSILGSNSLLKNDTEPWTIYAGIPARPIKTREKKIIYSFARELGYDHD